MEFTYNITFTVNDKDRIACIKSKTIGASTIIELLFKFQMILVEIIGELNEMQSKKEVKDDDIPF